jgi:hypothetical protein
MRQPSPAFAVLGHRAAGRLGAPARAADRRERRRDVLDHDLHAELLRQDVCARRNVVCGVALRQDQAEHAIRSNSARRERERRRAVDAAQDRDDEAAPVQVASARCLQLRGDRLGGGLEIDIENLSTQRDSCIHALCASNDSAASAALRTLPLTVRGSAATASTCFGIL